MSISNTFKDHSNVGMLNQHDNRSESNEESKKNKKSSKSFSLECESSDDIPQYAVEKQGLIVIFNQENFSGEKRVGSKEDVNALEQIFSDKEHFKIIYEQDTPREEIVEEIARVATNKKFQGHSYVIIFFLSHGHAEGIIELSTGGYITNEEIWQPFCSVDSIWRNKPKLFVFQACKGSRFTFVDNCNLPKKKVCTDIGKKHKMVPKEADILVAYCTVEGNVAIRPDSGTWYIQNLCKILKKYSEREDILDILTRVNHEIAKCEVRGKEIEGIPEELENKKIKQMSMFLSTLTKKFYFYSQANKT